MDPADSRKCRGMFKFRAKSPAESPVPNWSRTVATRRNKLAARVKYFILVEFHRARRITPESNPDVDGLIPSIARVTAPSCSESPVVDPAASSISRQYGCFTFDIHESTQWVLFYLPMAFMNLKT